MYLLPPSFDGHYSSKMKTTRYVLLLLLLVVLAEKPPQGTAVGGGYQLFGMTNGLYLRFQGASLSSLKDIYGLFEQWC